MILSATTDKVQVITSLGSTIDLDVITHFTDRNQSTGVIGAADRKVTTISSAATTDVVASPGATTTRSVRELTIRNAHATIPVEVVVQFNANGTLYEMYQARLFPTEMLQYTAREGFKIIARTARINASRVYHSAGNAIASVHNNAGDSLSFVPALTVPIPEDQATSGMPLLGAMACIFSTCNATTTGIGFDIGAQGRFPNFEITGLIGTVTLSVTASVHFAATNGSNHLTGILSTDSPGSSSSFAFLAHGMKFDTDATSTTPFGVGFCSELAATTVKIQPGSIFQAFQHTG
jgi:hypothetical protein